MQWPAVLAWRMRRQQLAERAPAEEALAVISLVKTWAMRGTLHLLVRDELPVHVGAPSRLRPRHHQPSWLRGFGVTREQMDALLAALPAVLAKQPLTREEPAAAVAARTRDAALEAKLLDGFGALLKPAAFTGDLSIAEGEGRRVRFTAPGVRPPSRRSPRAPWCAPTSRPTVPRRGSSSSAGPGGGHRPRRAAG